MQKELSTEVQEIVNEILAKDYQHETMEVVWQDIINLLEEKEYEANLRSRAFEEWYKQCDSYRKPRDWMDRYAHLH